MRQKALSIKSPLLKQPQVTARERLNEHEVE